MPTQMTNDIRELNLSYLMLAQAMIRADKAQASFRLGLDEDVCDLVAQLSPQQVVRCRSRRIAVARSSSCPPQDVLGRL